MRRLTILLVAVCLMWGAPLLAAPPQTINYQGYLTNASGMPVNGNVPMVFSLYTAASGGTLLWSESQSVAVTNGIYNTMLGSGTLVGGVALGSLPFNEPYYLGVNVNANGEMTPRQALSASPYAMRATIAGNGDAMPTGAIVAFAGGVVPAGWLLADGSAVSRATYAALYAVIGDTYGSGDLSTTFNLPNLQQRFPIGRAPTGRASVLGETGGTIDHAHSYSDVPNHVHPVAPPSTQTNSSGAHLHSPSNEWGYSAAAASGTTRRPMFDFRAADAFMPLGPIIASDGAHFHTVNIPSFASDAPVGGVASGMTTAQNPPYLTINYIIKR